MIGRTYLEKGSPVVVLTRWGDVCWRATKWTSYLTVPVRLHDAPRNVLIRRADGSLVVRPFRGLRKAPADALDIAGAA